MFWTTKSNRVIPIKELDNVYLANILKMLKRNAETKRQTLLAVYDSMTDLGGGIAESHFNKMYDDVMHQTWRDFVDDIFHDLEYEAARRRLMWDVQMASGLEDFPAISVSGSDRGSLERGIVGAIRDCINKHGNITPDNASSAAKRVIGVIKDHNRKVESRTRKQTVQ